jgi:hypothetical protein
VDKGHAQFTTIFRLLVVQCHLLAAPPRPSTSIRVVGAALESGHSFNLAPRCILARCPDSRLVEKHTDKVSSFTRRAYRPRRQRLLGAVQKIRHAAGWCLRPDVWYQCSTMAWSQFVCRLSALKVVRLARRSKDSPRARPIGTMLVAGRSSRAPVSSNQWTSNSLPAHAFDRRVKFSPVIVDPAARSEHHGGISI